MISKINSPLASKKLNVQTKMSWKVMFFILILSSNHNQKIKFLQKVFIFILAYQKIGLHPFLSSFSPSHRTVSTSNLQATTSIPKGSTLIVERPFAAVLLPDHYSTHCHHCFSSLPLTCIGCECCTTVRFCNEACRDAAWLTYHSTECSYLDLLHSVGIAHLSLRVVLCAGRHFLTDFLEHQEKFRYSSKPCHLGLNKSGQYDRGYLTVFDLVTHEGNTEGTDMLQYSMTAGLLLLTLSHSGFFSIMDGTGDSTNVSFDLSAAVFDNKNGKSRISLSDEMASIGGLLLRHILQLVCNAHAITCIQAQSHTEPNMDEFTSAVSGTEQTRIATAIYPTASLMNHSCQPTIMSSFVGDKLVVRNVKEVANKEEIFNCYGPHVCRMDREERQAVLQAQYHFTCECEACQAGAKDHRRFGAFKCPLCAGIMWDKVCLECGHKIDSKTFHSLKARAAACQQSFDNGFGLLNANLYEAALSKFEQCGKERQQFLYKDHRDLALVQDALARCHASLGDFCSAADHLISSIEFARALYGPTSPEYGHELLKLAEVLFNAGRVRECAQACSSCLNVLLDLYSPSHHILQEVKDLQEAALKALVPQVDKG